MAKHAKYLKQIITEKVNAGATVKATYRKLKTAFDSSIKDHDRRSAKLKSLYGSVTNAVIAREYAFLDNQRAIEVQRLSELQKMEADGWVP